MQIVSFANFHCHCFCPPGRCVCGHLKRFTVSRQFAVLFASPWDLAKWLGHTNCACTTRLRKTKVRTTPVRSQQCECQQCERVNSANETRVRMPNVRMPTVRCDIGAKKVRQVCEWQQCEKDTVPWHACACTALPTRAWVLGLSKPLFFPNNPFPNQNLTEIPLCPHPNPRTKTVWRVIRIDNHVPVFRRSVGLS